MKFPLKMAIIQQEWGAGIVSDNTNIVENSTATVAVLRLSTFVQDVVAKRILPKDSAKVKWTRPPTVLMKLDIEGV